MEQPKINYYGFDIHTAYADVTLCCSDKVKLYTCRYLMKQYTTYGTKDVIVMDETSDVVVKVLLLIMGRVNFDNMQSNIGLVKHLYMMRMHDLLANLFTISFSYLSADKSAKLINEFAKDTIVADIMMSHADVSKFVKQHINIVTPYVVLLFADNVEDLHLAYKGLDDKSQRYI